MRTVVFSLAVVMMFWGCDVMTQGLGNSDENSTASSSTYPSTIYKIYAVTDESQLPQRTVSTRAIEDLTRLFATIGYNKKVWDVGVEIPRLYLQRISCRWHLQSSKIPVKQKKEIFFKLMLPAILRANELILLERNQLLHHMNDPVDAEANEWLLDLAKKYKVIPKERSNSVNEEEIAKLLRRVDVIPPSLALAQAAEESGWATSRFAREGNALFGQWTFGKKAMIPKEQRSELGNYGLARFDTPQESINAYMRNLNTNRAYIKLRYKREALRTSGAEITGLSLSETLDKYSERGVEYVEGLKKLITHNHLERFDRAHLLDKEVIHVAPARVKVPEPDWPEDPDASE